MIRVGTCSWAEKSLLKSGEFYPRSVRNARDRLRYYAEHFSTVEINATYYALPEKRNSALWAESTPADFIFHVKAYGALTGHGVDPATLPEEIVSRLLAAEKSGKFVFIKQPSLIELLARKFSESLAPLAEAGKIGIAVFQFPPWFRYGQANLEYILFCLKMMGPLRIGVEFRHGSWLVPGNVEKIFGFLRDHNIVYIVADEAQFGNLETVPFLPAVTADIAYFRFHGRNRENWLKKGIETSLRYDYLYSEAELAELAGPVISAAAKTAEVDAMFNNCHGAAAVRNAARLKELVSGKGR